MKKVLLVCALALVLLTAIVTPAFALAPQSPSGLEIDSHSSQYADALFSGTEYSGEVKAYRNGDQVSKMTTWTWGVISTPRGIVRLYDSETEYQTPTQIPSRNFVFAGASMERAKLTVAASLTPSNGVASVPGTLTISWKGYGDTHTFYNDSTGRWLTRQATITATFDFPVDDGHWTFGSDGGYLDMETWNGS